MPCSSQPGLSNGTRELAADQSSVLTWIGEQIMSLLPTGGNLPTVNQELLQPFTNPFDDTTTNKVKNDALALLNYLSDTPLADLTMDNVTKKIATVADDLVKMIEGALSSMLKGAPGLLTATASFSTEPINNAALRQIYNLLNPGAPEAPTMNGLVALIAAAPTVLFRRMAFESSNQAVSATAGEPSVEGDFNQFLFAAGVYQLTAWNAVDILLDLNRAAAPDKKFLLRPIVWFCSVIMSAPLVVLTSPQLAGKPVDTTDARFAWLGGACNWVFNLAHIISKGTPARGTLPGATVTAFLGVYQLVALISTAIQTAKEKGFQVAPWLAVAGPLPTIAKAIPWWVPATPPYIVPILDFAGNTAAGVAKICASDIMASTTPQLSLDPTERLSG